MKGEWGAEGRLPAVTQLLKEVLLRGQQPLLLPAPATSPAFPNSLFSWVLVLVQFCLLICFAGADSGLKRDYFLHHSFPQNASKTMTETTIHMKSFSHKLFMSFPNSYDCVYYGHAPFS